MTIDFASSFYFHREGRGLFMGMSLDDEPPGFNLGRDDAWIRGWSRCSGGPRRLPTSASRVAGPGCTR